MNLYNKVANHAKEVDKLYPQHVRLFTALVGSQNYHMDCTTSDVDTKSILLPATANTLFFTDKVSHDYHVNVNGQEELCAVKDVRLYVNCLLKQNPNFVETLFSYEYVFRNKNTVGSNFVNFLFEERGRIARYDQFAMMKAIFGMAHQYFKRFEQSNGQDAKAAANVLRMVDMGKQYYDDHSFMDCLIPVHVQELLYLKHSSLEERGLEVKFIEEQFMELQNLILYMEYERPEWENKDTQLEEWLEYQLNELFKEVAMQEETWAG